MAQNTLPETEPGSMPTATENVSQEGRKTSVLGKLGDVLESPPVYLAYQWLVGGLRARHKCIRDYVPKRPGLTILDIGCGPGYVITDFEKPVYNGFDVSQQYIDYAKKKYPHGNFYCQIFDEATLRWLPRADVALMMGVLHHLDDVTALALLDLTKRALKPDGCLYTMDGCYREGQSRVGKFFLDEDRGKFVRNEPAYEKLARQVFKRVELSYRDDLFYIPYPSIVMQCRP